MSHFAGTAGFYADFRPTYPEEIWDRLLAELGPDANVIDLGCGPGTATLPLARRFASVTGIDADAEMIAEAKRQTGVTDVGRVDWVCASAEEVALRHGAFDLVIIGSAFHWMDREVVAERCHSWLRSGGRLILLGNPTPLMLTGDGSALGRAIEEVQQRWFGEDYYVFDIDELERPEDVVERAGFTDIVIEYLPHRQHWTVERYLGFLRSTSSRPDQRLGDRWLAFATDTTTAIREVVPSGEWTLDIPVEVISGLR